MCTRAGPRWTPGSLGCVSRQGLPTIPNIVVFMTDQQRGATVLPGDPLKAITPHVDALASDGVTFTRAHTVSPHCCPSRTSFHTGLPPSTHGVWNNVNVANALRRTPYADTRFWSQDLAEAGFRLGFAGKWHVSNTMNPRDVGWQECLVTAPGAAGEATEEQQRAAATERDRELAAQAAVDHDPGRQRRPGEILRPGYTDYVHYRVNPDPYGDRAVVDSAIEFITSAAEGDQPWISYVGTLGPHDPYQPPQEFLDLYDLDAIELPETFDDPMHDKPALYRRIRDRFDQLTEQEHREALRHYLAFCSYEDHLFGRVRDAVAASGQLEDTIFVYLSDHGDYAGDHGLWCKGLPAFTSAYHVPLVIGGAPLGEDVRGTTVTDLVSMIDLGPTLMELCGREPTAPMPGHSLVPALRGEPLDGPGEVYFASNGNETLGNQRVVMTDRWMLVVNLFDADELYDLVNDPGQRHNLLHRDRPARRTGITEGSTVPSELREVVDELYARMWRFGLAHGDDLTCNYILTALGHRGPGIVLG